MTAILLLASTSPYRRRVLERLGLPFAVESPRVDERVQAGEEPAARALRLAHAKAAAVAARHPQAWVLGSDQVADCGGTVLDKPGDAARCRSQLQAESGRAVHFHTAAVLMRVDPASVQEHLDLTVVRFRALSDAEISRYVELEAPWDCAGAFRSEGLGAALFESIDTRDPCALIGLPLIWVATALRACGLDPLTGAGNTPAAP
ncbi:MAG TPA: nucleoside triphosphate pyrophosphatase [Steroidobacteraceae bacterium]|nr:nucleoside triphosphate pyrophosphatase [Steroidobacteraceae bacterium]